MAYRVPRRFIVPPGEPPPYGLVALSFLGHSLFLVMAMAVSTYVSSQADQSKIYIVNLVPASAPLGSPTPRVAERPVRTPEPTPPKAKAEREPPPRTPAKAEAPPPREAAPPKPEKPTEVARATPPRPAELALPRRVEKETPALQSGAMRERLLAKVPAPPKPSAAPPPPLRAPEAPRVAPPQAPPASPAVAAVRPGVEPMRLGRPDSAVPTTGSISLDVSDFPFTYYLRQITAKISDRWAPPRAAVAGGEKAVVVFEIGRDGSIKEPAVERSSGNALYDQSALRAVMEASPFPPLPPEFKAPSLRVHFGFEFQPDRG